MSKHRYRYTYPLNKYMVSVEGNKITAISTYAGERVEGVARCHPTDAFNYDKGLACIGTNDDALYVHYDMYKSENVINFGSDNIQNTIPISDLFSDFGGGKIFKINTDEGIKLYFIY